MSNRNHYKIGTRGSLLALTQCTQIKNELERLTGDSFELEVLKTQGDLITDKPLWQLDGKDFFTKELDHALLTGAVDLVVHSYKDLGSERPEGIDLAAITKRTYAHDILFIKNETISKLKDKPEFIVGTSSPRRIVNLEKNLERFLPTTQPIEVKTKMLRGNVNTRISKLRDDNYDAIVLALPGIERLAHSPESLKELTALLEGMNYMILPQSVFPSAASQGALGIECLKTSLDLKKKLKLIEDEVTVQEVSRERKAFAKYGGGCHLAVGINVRKFEDDFIHIHKGTSENKDISKFELESSRGDFSGKKEKVFIGLPEGKLSSKQALPDLLIEKKPISINETQKSCDIFVTSTYCNQALECYPNIQNLWTAGTKTMEALAKKGYWVNGSSDSLGEVELSNLRNSHCIALMKEKKELFVLSHDKSTSIVGEVVGCYERVQNNLTEDYLEKLKETEIFYWTSYPQYVDFTDKIPSIKNKFHCTGLGKTYQRFKENGLEVKPFTSVKEFQEWIEKR